MTPAQLKSVTDSLEALDEVRAANLSEPGWWLRLAQAAEGIAGASTSANAGIDGYMERTARALESLSGTSGAEENANEFGRLKRIVDALEGGVVGAGDLANRFVIAAGTYTAGPDVTPPTITSSAAASAAENTTLAHALTANEAVTWAIRTAVQDAASVDHDKFELSGSTLRWTSDGTKDYEAPDDTGANNTYVVVVRATDGATNTSDQTITITVTDMSEGAGAGEPVGLLLVLTKA